MVDISAIPAPASTARPTSFEPAALARGHTAGGHFQGQGQTLFLAFAPLDDLDSAFQATCLETGELIRVCGWQFEAEVDPDGLVASLDGSGSLHRVLHDALADCHPAVAALIRDWGHRDPVDAMTDARLLQRAMLDRLPLGDRPDASLALRRAWADWTRDHAEDARNINAVRLAQVMTDWADAVLDEAISAAA